MEDVEKWIDDRLNKGYSREKIKQALKEEGYRETMIDSMFDDLKNAESNQSNRMEKGWFESVKSVLASPNEFFNKMPRSNGYGSPLKFFAINYSIFGLIFGTIFVFLFSSVLSMISGTIGGQATQIIQFLRGLSFFGIPIMVLFMLIVAVPLTFLGSVVDFLLIKLFGGKGSFEGTFRVTAYLSSILLLGWIPILNFIIGIYGVYIMLVGFSEVHEISKIRVLLTLLLPGVIIGGIIFGLSIFSGNFNIPINF